MTKGAPTSAPYPSLLNREFANQEVISCDLINDEAFKYFVESIQIVGKATISSMRVGSDCLTLKLWFKNSDLQVYPP